MISKLLRKLSCQRKMRRAVISNKKWTQSDQERFSFYRKFISEGELVFDVGANKGNRTKIFMKLCATVVAIEPQEDCASVLYKSFGGNSNFNLLKEGLSKSSGEMELYLSPENTVSSMSQKWIENAIETNKFPGTVWDESTTVKTRTLDQLIQSYGKPNFIKIDVEGFEEDVLLGLSQKCSFISFEFTLGYLRSTVNCLKRLHTLGYEYFQICYGEEMAFKLDKWSKIERIILELKNKDVAFGDIYAK